MPIIYDKMIALMNERGITSYVCKRDNIIGQATYKKIMQGGDIDTRTIATMCEVLRCQPGDILEYVKDKSLSKLEKAELRKIVERIPDNLVNEQLSDSLAELIRAEDWHDISDSERCNRVNTLIQSLKSN